MDHGNEKNKASWSNGSLNRFYRPCSFFRKGSYTSAICVEALFNIRWKLRKAISLVPPR